MKTYEVSYTLSKVGFTEVEAENEADAKRLVEQQYWNGQDLFYHEANTEFNVGDIELMSDDKPIHPTITK